MKRIWGALMAVLATGNLSARAAGAGDEVVVVYNARVPESKAVAEHYAQRRGVPTNQVFGFDLPASEEITRGEFRDFLQRPLADALESNKLWRVSSRVVPATNSHPGRVDWLVTTSKIRYAVLCYGVPVKILKDDTLKEEGAEQLRPEMRRNEAAVDSELALLPLLRQRLPLSGPLRNPVYTTTNTAHLHPTNGVLIVTRLDGPSPEIARGLVDKAILADREGLWGRAYFDLRNTTEPGYKQGDDWIRNAAELCRHLGFETVVDENPGTFPASFPMDHIAYYAGWYEQDVSGPFARPVVEFMPGAFAYHLHSYSAGVLRSTNRFWAGPLLAKGATATMGCVNEPYLSGTPDIGIFTARFIYNGFTFGEAALASQPVLSWQTTVVGDPLYRPFGTNPDLLHDKLLSSRSPLLEWSYLRLLNANLANARPLNDCVSFLEQLDLTKDSAVLTEKLADLYALQGKPSSATHMYLQALKLKCSPQQRLRLLLTAGDKLFAADRFAEADEQYQAVLKEYPDYADKLGLFRKLLATAHKLNKTAEANKFQAEIDRLTAPPPAPAPSTPAGTNKS